MIVHAGEADVIRVEVKKIGTNTYRFDVTVTHKDEGWDHYVDKWDVLGPEGVVLGTRILHHPHVDEQPFTRSLSGVKISGSVHRVTIRAHDSVHEYGGKHVTIALPQ
ncbi:hypothetical protein ACFL0O_10270 [Thermodesulfobacteriota bacterium]